MQNSVVMPSLSPYLCEDWAAHKGTYYHRRNYRLSSHQVVIRRVAVRFTKTSKTWCSVNTLTSFQVIVVRSCFYLLKYEQNCCCLLSFHCLFFFWGGFQGQLWGDHYRTLNVIINDVICDVSALTVVVSESWSHDFYRPDIAVPEDTSRLGRAHSQLSWL